MPDGVNIPGGPSFIGLPQPPDVPCDPTGDGWRGPPGPRACLDLTGPMPPGGPFLPLTGGHGTGPVNYTATGGTTSRSAQDRAAEAVNVKDFSAKGDGITDDTAAINAALNYIRANLGPNTGSGYHSPFRLVFPAAKYLVTAPLNFTGLNSICGGVIDGQGSEIWAKMSGGIVIDCTGSRFLRSTIWRSMAIRRRHRLSVFNSPR